MPDLRDDWTPFATGHVKCPDCDQMVPVPIEAWLDDDNEIHLRPVLMDVHAHNWTHDQGAVAS
ncbi:MAG TPA: hypothetical protein VFY84_19540 [Jiangellales bacterium]|nr:hypothetical protein [Jiangellales bacterium]